MLEQKFLVSIFKRLQKHSSQLNPKIDFYFSQQIIAPLCV